MLTEHEDDIYDSGHACSWQQLVTTNAKKFKVPLFLVFSSSSKCNLTS